jgi:hypothetical protein
MFPLLSSVGTTMSAPLGDEQINLRATSGTRGDLHRTATTSTTTGTAVGQEKKHTSAHAPIHVNLRIHTGFAKKRNNRDPNPSKITTLAGTVIVDEPALLGPTTARATAGKTLTAGISPCAVQVLVLVCKKYYHRKKCINTAYELLSSGKWCTYI